MGLLTPIKMSEGHEAYKAIKAFGNPRTGMKISVEGLSVRFHAGPEVLRDVSFEVSSGEFVALIGPSGCGKSTTLNAIASLVPPEEALVSGEILIDGLDIRQGASKAGSLGYVFQRDTLFPWRTVLQNVESGLEILGRPKAERREEAQRLIDMVGLSGFEHYYPHQISGGMRQRTSLIRTLAQDPRVILMDEPFGALDAQTRMNLQGELIRIWAKRRKTILFVTHDLAEAITLGERVILFSKRPGTVLSVYEVPFPHPRDPFELRGSAEFADLHASIWRTVSGEFRGAGVGDWP
jgi:NitT/TauT family transport system ATP-binding protein